MSAGEMEPVPPGAPAAFRLRVCHAAPRWITPSSQRLCIGAFRMYAVDRWLESSPQAGPLFEAFLSVSYLLVSVTAPGSNGCAGSASESSFLFASPVMAPEALEETHITSSHLESPRVVRAATNQSFSFKFCRGSIPRMPPSRNLKLFSSASPVAESEKFKVVVDSSAEAGERT